MLHQENEILLYQGINCLKILAKLQARRVESTPVLIYHDSIIRISFEEKKDFRITAAAKLSNCDKNCNIKEDVCYTNANYIQSLHQGKLIVM